MPVPADAELLQISASQFGVLWTPMAPFFVGKQGESQLRLSCSYLTPAEIDEGARRLAALLSSL